MRRLTHFHFFNTPISHIQNIFLDKDFYRKHKWQVDIYEWKVQTGLGSRDLLAIGERIWAKYAPIQSTEIISHEIFKHHLRQIQFAMIVDLLIGHSTNVVLDCSTLLNHLREQAELAKKNLLAQMRKEGTGSLSQRSTDRRHTVLMKMGDKRVTILTIIIYILATSQNPSAADGESLNQHDEQIFTHQ